MIQSVWRITKFQHVKGTWETWQRTTVKGDLFKETLPRALEEIPGYNCVEEEKNAIWQALVHEGNPNLGIL